MTTEKTSITWSKDADGIVTLTLDDPEKAANTTNDLYKESMARTVARLVSEKDSTQGVIITSAKKTFFAGGDLLLLVQAGPPDARKPFNGVPGMTRELRALRKHRVPAVPRAH